MPEPEESLMDKVRSFLGARKALEEAANVAEGKPANAPRPKPKATTAPAPAANQAPKAGLEELTKPKKQISIGKIIQKKSE